MLRNKRIRYLIIILTFFVLACVSDIFIIHTHVLFSTTDMPFHLKRVMELYNGNYLSSFSFNYFHGSAVMSMYPYFSLYPLVLLLHITSSYLYAYYYFFILIIFAALLISFFSSLRFSKSEVTSYLFAILYSLSIAFLINYFHNGDLGITTSLVFLPLVIFGILDVLNESGGYIKLSLGLTFMAYCQLPTTIIAGLFIILLILININRINKLIFYNLLKSAILTILLTSIVWIPFLKIILFNKITTPTSSQIQSANIVSIIKNVGFLPILSIFALPFYFKKFSRYVKQMYCLSVAIIIIASSYVPLIRLIASIKFFHFINTFQFTARFLIIPQVILCYLSSWLIVKWISHFNKFNFSFVGIIILVLLSQFAVQMFVVHNEFNQKYLYADSYQSIRMFSPVAGHYMIKKPWMKYLLNGYMNNSDYYPAKSIPKQKYIVNNEATYGHDRTINVKHTGYNRFSFNSSKKINRLALPLLHYNDEHLRVYVNHHLVRYRVNKNSLITLSNVKKGRNDLHLKYFPTFLEVLLEKILFIIGFILLFLEFIKNRYSKYINKVTHKIYNKIIYLNKKSFINQYHRNKKRHQYIHYHYIDIIHFWSPAFAFWYGALISFLLDFITLYYIDDKFFHPHINFTDEEIYLLSKYFSFNFGIFISFYYLIMMIIMFILYLKISLIINNSDMLVKVNINYCLIDMFKYSMEYIFTMFNILLAVMSIILALNDHIHGNIWILNMVTIISPILATLKFLQIWYSFKLSKCESKHFTWDSIYKIFHALE